MRAPVVPLAAITLGGTLACSGVGAPTAPTAAATSTAETSATARRDPVDVSGYWLPDYPWLVWDYPDDPENPYDSSELLCIGYALPEFEEWNQFLLEQDGSRIVGRMRDSAANFQCGWWGGGAVWSLDFDDTITGRVQGNEIRLELSQRMDIRATLDPDGQTMTGTIRMWMDPRPYAEPFWIEHPVTLSRTTGWSIYPGT